MKLEYNQTNNSLVINDNLRNQYMAIGFVLGINIFNGVAFYLTRHERSEWLGYIWLFLGIISVILILDLGFRKSSKKEIPLSEIQFLREKKIFGSKRFSLKLNNGKLRHLSYLKSESAKEAAESLITSLGIPKR